MVILAVNDDTDVRGGVTTIQTEEGAMDDIKRIVAMQKLATDIQDKEVRRRLLRLLAEMEEALDASSEEVGADGAPTFPVP